MTHNTPSLVTSTENCPSMHTDNIYSRAQEKAKTMQYAIRSGQSSGGEKRRRYHDEESDDPEREGMERDGTCARLMKKPRLPRSPGADRGEERSHGYELPITTLQLDVVWIPESQRGGRDWVKTITFRDLLQQLKKQKVKLLLDQEDDTSLVVEEDEMSDNCDE
ncbi:hypothetical protein P691DRAFT_809063 [Macrolepiota fuliginosa MF-IS2]|uniref:Uncharacterized protein n=1 Tax=Macrolepiota fuliginosa MF-IS2 TaxID=1400762 RepID=A0A9P6BXS1_9AGAR|nr:hypothetical protein P691DRAFT_809063 [Macrolepiota fuliginosa MF-IS2]